MEKYKNLTAVESARTLEALLAKLQKLPMFLHLGSRFFVVIVFF